MTTDPYNPNITVAQSPPPYKVTFEGQQIIRHAALLFVIYVYLMLTIIVIGILITVAGTSGADESKSGQFGELTRDAPSAYTD